MHEHEEHLHLNERGLKVAFTITLLIMVAEAFGGFWANSLALFSDAGHMLADTFALGLSLGAVKMAQRPATHERTYGWHRLEILAALGNGLLLTLISAGIFYEAVQRFLHPSPVHGPLMLVIAVIGLIANLVGITILQGSSRENLNVRGAFLHMLGDTLSSVGVIIGAIFIVFTGWNAIDPIISILINGFILRSAFQLIFESGEILLESVPRGIILVEVMEAAKKVEGVQDLHDLHIWTITSGIHALSAHVLIADQKVSEGSEILREVEEILAKEFKITHTTLQLECESCGEGLICKSPKGR